MNEHQWEMSLSRSGELSFYYQVWTYPEKDIWAMFDDSSDPYMKSISSEQGMTFGISPFLLIHFFMKNVVSFAKEVSFFYFKPSTKQRSKIFTNLTERLLNELDGSWSCQIVDNCHYYTRDGYYS